MGGVGYLGLGYLRRRVSVGRVSRGVGYPEGQGMRGYGIRGSRVSTGSALLF